METFTVHYLISCYEMEQIEEKLRWICLEQSVELPEEAVSNTMLQSVAGKISEIEELNSNQFKASIAWPLENTGYNLTQLLNILYGNISLKRGIKITSVNWRSLESICKGPKFGIQGIRDLFQVQERPMACAVLKPMGLTADELAGQARQLALGGIDMIKDDHGLANQKYAPFKERIAKVADMVHKTSNETGKPTYYFPNITDSGSKVMQKYRYAADIGADGVMIIPHLCGYEVMHELAQSDTDLPIIAHPAFSGTLVTDSDHGFTPAFLYGELYRAFGADFTVYPNTGGRYSFSLQNCLDINEAARSISSPFKPIFPMPGGGVKKETISEWIKTYGPETVFLIGASLLQQPEGIQKATEELYAILSGEN